jgi:uncharacterized C2H2 Zn-finger protein
LQPYICIAPECTRPDILFGRRRDWISHQNQHEISESQIKCPLCLEALRKSSSFYKHVANHLEQLSLFVLPDRSFDQDEEENAEEDNASLGSSPRSEESRETPSVQSIGFSDSINVSMSPAETEALNVLEEIGDENGPNLSSSLGTSGPPESGMGRQSAQSKSDHLEKEIEKGKEIGRKARTIIPRRLGSRGAVIEKGLPFVEDVSMLLNYHIRF